MPPCVLISANSMRWNDEGILLISRRHGERGLIVEVLTAVHGRHAGLVRGGQRPQLRGIYQIGNRIALTWSARLIDHLGTFTGELVVSHAAHFINDRARLSCLAAATALAVATLPEREPHPRLYAAMTALLGALDRNGDYILRYVKFELDLLAELGYGLDLSRCVATGTREDLTHVSPKSGQAVSATAAAPHRERLLALPRFLLDATTVPNSAEVAEGLELTGFFLERRVFHPHGRRMPAARMRFVDLLCRTATLATEQIELA